MRSLRWFDRVVLTACVAFAVLPVATVAVSAFKTERDIFSYVPVLLFRPVLENFVSLLDDWDRFIAGLLNSAVVTAGSVALVLAVALPAAYAWSRFDRSRARRTALVALGLKMLPPFIVTVPLFPIFKLLHLADSRLGLVLVYAAFEVAVEVFILKTFIDQVPAELEEAAMLDGCTRAGTFRRVVLPLIWPGILAVVVFVMLFAWNDYMFGLVLTTPRTETAPVVLADMFASIGEGGASWGQVFAAATLQMAPVLLLVWLAQRRMLAGALVGAMKG